MPIICKHGLDGRFCAACQQAKEIEPLRRDALRVTNEGKPALILRTILGSLNVTVLLLDGTTIRFEAMEEISLRHPMTVISLNQQKVFSLFLKLALQKGYLFQPNRELTYREQTEEGPSRCYSCHTELSLAKHSFGCTQCRKYVCHCGRCLCGYEGKNYLGQVFNQSPELPISLEERLEFVRVVRFCDLNIQPVSSARKVNPRYLVRIK